MAGGRHATSPVIVSGSSGQSEGGIPMYDQLIEKLARTIALVNGKDPDQLSWGMDEESNRQVQRPTWHFYRRQAEMHIEVYKVLKFHDFSNS